MIAIFSRKEVRLRKERDDDGLLERGAKEVFAENRFIIKKIVKYLNTVRTTLVTYCMAYLHFCDLFLVLLTRRLNYGSKKCMLFIRMYVYLCSLCMCVWNFCMYASVMHVWLYRVSIEPATDEWSSMVRWWNNTERGIPEYSETNLSQCDFVCHTPHVDWSRILFRHWDGIFALGMEAWCIANLLRTRDITKTYTRI